MAVYQEDEKIRRLRVHLVLLETHNEALQMQIANNDDYVQELKQSQDTLKAKIKEAGISFEIIQGDLRIKSREIETLKVGIRHGSYENAANATSGRAGLVARCHDGFD
ncbi:MAG: hypothetical protein Q9205_006207 [Flavoplaca limonia]